MMTKKLLRLVFILLLSPIPAFAGLDDRRYLPREAPYSREQFKQSLTLAEKGDAYAQYLVCAAYYAGKVINKNYQKALSWCTLAAEQGLKQAQFWLGYFYFDNLVVERDDEKAVYWFELSARQNYADAQYHLGLMYEKGRGIEKNHESAVYWYQAADKQGHQRASEKLRRYRTFEEKLALAEQGDTSTHSSLAHECLVGDIAHPACKDTLLWCTTAANGGSATYQTYLGELYLEGQAYKYGYRMQRAPEKAYYWLELAAKQNHIHAQYLLGSLYENGTGVKQDHNKAIYWYELSAKQNGWRAKEALKRLRKQRWLNRLKNLFGGN